MSRSDDSDDDYVDDTAVQAAASTAPTASPAGVAGGSHGPATAAGSAGGGGSLATPPSAQRAAFVAQLKSIAQTMPPSFAALKTPHPVQTQHLLAAGVTMRPYQTTGVAWMDWLHSHGLSGILADEMGLGKTLQSIAYIAQLAQQSANKTLVVVPLSVFDSWIAEFAKFAPSVSVVKLRGSAQERVAQQADIQTTLAAWSVLITTFETVLSESTFLQSIGWHYLVVDEAHRLKNRDSLLHQSLANLNIRHCLLLTGTPVQNNLAELQSLLAFANPALFSVDAPRGPDFEGWFGKGCGRPNALDELTDALKPFILRRTKEQVVDLPAMKEVVVHAPLTKIQRATYLSILSQDWSVFDSKRVGSLRNILVQLRKCVAHPYLFDGVEPEPFLPGEHLVETSGKLMVLDQLLKHAKANNRRVLVFSQMTHLLDIVQDYLTMRQYSYERLDGSVRGEERFLSVNEFQAGGVFVFLLSTRAGGVGLTLTAADTAIFLDTDFNPTVDQQAAARLHRIGQTKQTTIVRIVCPDTVDDVVWRRAQRKMELQKRIMKRDADDGGDDGGGSWAPKQAELVSMLKFGLHKIMDANQRDDDFPVLSQSDLDNIFSHDARPDAALAGQPTAGDTSHAASGSSHVDDDADDADASIYLYDGQDYKTASAAMDALRQQTSAAAASSSGVIGRKRRLDDLDDEEIAKMLAERHQQAEQRKRDKRFASWAAQQYTSCALDEDGVIEVASLQPTATATATATACSSSTASLDDAAHETVDTPLSLMYASGDVTQPQSPPTMPAIIVHVVDDSGSWPNMGMFRAVASLSPAVRQYYIQSGLKTVKNLHMGSAHLLAVSAGSTRLMVALVVAQKASARDRLQMDAFADGLKRVARAARRLGATVHLPRIGHNLPNVTWYSVERVISKVLPQQGVETTIYYYSRART
ncbi:SNF2 family N-terminal domain-containing protein [Entophlyctis helioformis]|nr:SNF2 family N-terminal domain-containing protein [Entophlyctis helioformis]